MALISAGEITKRVKQNDIDRLYYFYGHDTAALEKFTRSLIKRLCPPEASFMNLHKFEAKDMSFEELNDACMALPMMADRVVVAVNDLDMEKIPKSDGDYLRKILGDIGEGTTVIIYSTGVDLYKNKKYLTDKNKRFADFCGKIGTVCEFGYRSPSELARSISAALAKAGCEISKPDAQYLAAMCLCDSAFINNEIQKLSAYAQGREITRRDIDTVCIRHIESDGYDLAANLLGGNANYVFNRVRELSVQNYEAFEILNIIAFSIADIYRAKLARSSGRGVEDVVKDFGYTKSREFVVKNAYSRCGSISLKRIRETVRILSDTDNQMKTMSLNKQGCMLALEQGLAESMALRC